VTGIERFRYYFVDLPLWASGRRSRALERRLYKVFEEEIPLIRNGYEVLAGYLKRPVSESDVGDLLRKAFLVRIVRESDAYTSLRMSGKKVERYFRFEGMDHLDAARNERRPVIILTGHIGSFFIAPIAFHHLGYEVHPIARTVDTSAATPRLNRLYLSLNYRLPETRFPARYLLTDFAGKIDRRVVSISKKNGIFWVAIDFPWRLYQHKHLPVRLFGRPATLPSGIVRWGIKKNALFLTGWNTVEEGPEGFYRLLSVDGPLEDQKDAGAVVQAYADRLSERVAKSPWQWMALPAISQYGEGCAKIAEGDSQAAGAGMSSDATYKLGDNIVT
jgi:lauroyl/myristoyl acyltransferase